MTLLRQHDNAHLSEFFNLDDPNIFVSDGVVSNIFFHDRAKVDWNATLQKLRCRKGQQFYTLLTPAAVPVRYHYAATKRVGDIVLESAIGALS